MASSRTSTAAWRRIREQTLRRARANGQTLCPYCKRELNYRSSRQSDTAEVDHIIPHSQGGPDTPDNLVVICRRCNQSKGDRSAPRAKIIQENLPLVTSRQW